MYCVGLPLCSAAATRRALDHRGSSPRLKSWLRDQASSPRPGTTQSILDSRSISAYTPPGKRRLCRELLRLVVNQCLDGDICQLWPLKRQASDCLPEVDFSKRKSVDRVTSRSCRPGREQRVVGRVLRTQRQHAQKLVTTALMRPALVRPRVQGIISYKLDLGQARSAAGW